MSIRTVQQLCEISPLVQDDGLVDQIANVEDLHRDKIDPDAFFRRNHFTDGLNTLIRSGFDRLSGRSDAGAFYLSQSMGGGKTHSLIAFALLAQDDGLRHRIIPSIAPTATFGSAKVVVFNGHQNPPNFLWGEIAERLGRPDAMSRFWKDGAKAPGVNDWIAAIGDTPVLILLDELPSYLQMAEGQLVGNSTLADITIGALERLFNALSQLPAACVVVTNLLDDVFSEGSSKLKTLINTLNKQYGKYAQAITPVQQNSGEVFQIIRKKLFDKLPDDDVIEEIAQAYVDELNKAKRVDDIPVVPESYIARIRDTYPFHPSIRDVVARFKENPGYQQTRALIRILRLAVRNAWKSTDPIFLIGLQHLDFNTQGVVEEVRKINTHFTNAISKDVADRGNAKAEQIDAGANSTTATSVAKLILMASLSTAEQPILGLRRNEIVEILIDPLTKTPAIASAIDKITQEAEYLFFDPSQRIFFGQTANVTSEINNTASSLAEEVVDQELRRKLENVFEPKTKSLYRQLAILPSLDEIKIGDEDVTLIIVERSAAELPAELVQWWEALDRRNRVLILTADRNALGTLRSVARQMRAIAVVGAFVLSRHGKESPQMRDVEKTRERAANQFTSAVREAFSSLVFPTGSALRDYSQFRMEFDNNDYKGEEQILKTLEERGKFYPAAKIEKDIRALRAEAEEELFDADAVPRTELRRKAAAKPGWYWLASGGLDYVINESVRTKHWRERSNVIEKKFTRQTSVQVRLDGAIEPMIDKGVYRLTVTPEDADVVYASEHGPPDPNTSARVQGRLWETSASKAWFLAVDSKGEAASGPVLEWLAPVRLSPSAQSTSAGVEITWAVLPRSAQVRITFDGTDPRARPSAKAPMLAPEGSVTARLIAIVDERISNEIEVNLVGGKKAEKQVLRDDLPVLLLERQEFVSITTLTDALEALKLATGATIGGGKLEIGTEEGDLFVDTVFGDHVAFPPTAIEIIMSTIAREAGFEATRSNGAFNTTKFTTGKDFRVYADTMKLDYESLKWTQDDVG